jgi:uncharacterized protein (TIGR00369 family)
VDEIIAKNRFATALAEQAPEFGRFFLARFFDLRVSYGDETCRVELPVADYMFNPQGSLHGGVIAFAMDISMGHLCHQFLSSAVTLEMKTQYLRPVTGDCWCEGRFIKKGREVVFLESRLFDEKDRLAAIATSTWRRLPGKGDEGQTAP